MGEQVSHKILVGDVRNRLLEIEEQSVQTVITSPPYWGLRDYGNDGQIGLEQTPDDYVAQMVLVFREVWRVLRDDGTVWLNIGDSYSSARDSKAVPDSLRNGEGTFVGNAANRNSANLKSAGLKHKDLVGIPWRVAFALQADGWYLRQDIIWAKPNPMPESVKDRCTKSHEYLFLLTKSAKYYYDNESIKEPAVVGYKSNEFIPKSAKDLMDATDLKSAATSASSSNGNDDLIMTRNKRDVWTVPTKPFKGAHFAVMPEALVQPCILAGSRENDLILDPFTGSGTVGVVAKRLNRNFVGVELNSKYAEIAEKRIGVDLFD